MFNEVLGVEVKLPERPERIVSLAENITETLFMLGVGDRVVGISVYCFRPKEAAEKPKVGGYLKVSYKKIEELKPDLILVTSGAQRRLGLELHKRGYNVYAVPLPISLYGIMENVLEIGAVVGAVEEATELATTLERKITEARLKLHSRVKAYVELDLGSPITPGAASHISHALRILGAANIFDYVKKSYFTPPMDKVIELDPELIIYEAGLGVREPRRKLEELLERRGWGELTAVKLGGLIATQGDTLAHYGPSFVTETLFMLRRVVTEVAEERA